MKRFKNPHIQNARRTLWDLFLWKIGHYDDPAPYLPPPLQFQYPTNLALFDSKAPSIVWIGHSTFLIEIDGIHLLTDPVWDDYCSPIAFRALKRKHAPPLSLSDLPPIDYVLLSHNHYDHLDAKTVRHLKTFHPQIQWIIPVGMKSWFSRKGIDSTIELNWWQSHESKVKVTAVPAQHFSGRGLFDKNKSLWNGYVLEKGEKRLYFTGDTGYNQFDFKEIGNKMGPFDLSLIPIGTYAPYAFMSPVHCSPWEAVEIHKDVQSKFSIGMHWKTFCLSEEPMERPPYDLFLAMEKSKLPPEQFLPLEPGTYVNW